MCYATSTDGLVFEKPALGIVKDAPIGVEGWNVSVSGDSNIILMNDPSRLSWGGTWDSHVTIDGSCVWMDLDDPDRCSRYKLMTVGAHGSAGSQYAFWASPDGVNFTLVANSVSCSCSWTTREIWRWYTRARCLTSPRVRVGVAIGCEGVLAGMLAGVSA